jgi:hypothetical protein
MPVLHTSRPTVAATSDTLDFRTLFWLACCEVLDTEETQQAKRRLICRICKFILQYGYLAINKCQIQSTTLNMKEAFVSPDSSVKIVDSPKPTPGTGDILIKVVFAGTNPKDWKFPSVSNTTLNSGDDISGTVEEVGEGVLKFRSGDRVAAFHRLGESGGAFAEYAIAPSTTTFHLPENISFEEVLCPFMYRE